MFMPRPFGIAFLVRLEPMFVDTHATMSKLPGRIRSAIHHGEFGGTGRKFRVGHPIHDN